MIGSFFKGAALGWFLSSKTVLTAVALAAAGYALSGGGTDLGKIADKISGNTRGEARAEAPWDRKVPATAQGACKGEVDADAPTVPEKMRTRTVFVCKSGFAVLHSGLTKGPLWASQRLTRERIREAKDSETKQAFRESGFFAETEVPSSDRSSTSDYTRSGYDRGHMAPLGDMADPASQSDSFSLANVVPQNPQSNRNLWADIERATRSMATERGEVMVVTGVLFEGSDIETIGRDVYVPTRLFKAVLDRRRNEGAAYLASNGPGRGYDVVDLATLKRVTGIDAFPAYVGAAKMRLAEPIPYQRRSSR